MAACLIHPVQNRLLLWPPSSSTRYRQREWAAFQIESGLMMVHDGPLKSLDTRSFVEAVLCAGPTPPPKWLY